MYPNLYFVFKDWFGVEINAFKIFYTFGIFVAISFIVAAWLLTKELKRKEKQGLLLPREETITTGKPASFLELFINGIVGFIFGYKLVGAFMASGRVTRPGAAKPPSAPLFSTSMVWNRG